MPYTRKIGQLHHRIFSTEVIKMELTREQQQYIWDVMADIYSRKLGAKVEFTLPPEKEQEAASTKLSGVASKA